MYATIFMKRLDLHNTFDTILLVNSRGIEGDCNLNWGVAVGLGKQIGVIERGKKLQCFMQMKV